jgi:hypothetical protein
VDENKSQQYGRVCTLLVSNRKLDGLDLSQFRIKFSVKRSDTMTPNVADIRVYNLSDETVLKIQKEFTQVTLQAGYESNFGVIFQGNIKQVIAGRESATDTFIDIVAGDGDRAYNFAIVNTTIAKGSTQKDQVNAAVSAMTPKGVTAGHLGDMPTSQLPRGKVMYGNARNYLRNVAQTDGSSWSIQDEKVNFVPKKSYLPGERIVLTSKTGMIGTPQQTNEGVNVKCLINPNIRIGGRIQIDNKSIARFKINLSVPNSPANIPAPLTADGVYYVLVVEHSGDNRGVDWYSSLICLNIDVTTNPLNSVQVGYGG